MGMFSVRYSPWMKEDGGAEVHHGIEAQPVYTSPKNKQTEKLRLICLRSITSIFFLLLLLVKGKLKIKRSECLSSD